MSRLIFILCFCFVSVSPAYALKVSDISDEVRNGMRLEATGKYSQALEIYDEVIKKYPEKNATADAYFQRGRIYLDQKKNKEKAIADFSKAVEIDPSYPDFVYILGRAYYEDGQWQKALESMKKVVELKPSYEKGAGYYGIGRAYFKLEKFDKAIENINKALRQDSKNPRYYLDRGLCYYKLEKFKKCQDDFIKTVELDFGGEFGTAAMDSLEDLKKKIAQQNDSQSASLKAKPEKSMDSGSETEKETFENFKVSDDKEDKISKEKKESRSAMPIAKSPEEQHYFDAMVKTAKDLGLSATVVQRKSKTRYEIMDSRYFATLGLTKVAGRGDEFESSLGIMTGNSNTTLKTFMRDLCEHFQKMKAAGNLDDGMQYSLKTIEGNAVCYSFQGTEENISENKARSVVNGEVELTAVSYPYEKKALNAMEMMKVFIKNYKETAK